MKIQLTQAIYQHTNFSEVFTFFSYFIKKNAIHHVTTAQLTILTYKDLILNRLLAKIKKRSTFCLFFIHIKKSCSTIMST